MGEKMEAEPMRPSATKLRWLSLAGVVLLAGIVAGFLGLARYRAARLWQHILARNGVNLHRDTNGITWSQSSGGRTIFTLHASRATPQGRNRWALHDAVLVLYGREPGRDDRIYGREFEYDGNQGVARALGEVHLDLQTPGPSGGSGSEPRPAQLGFGVDGDPAADSRVIHVRTSGLVYTRKLGIAATSEPTEFRFGKFLCTSHGAEFDAGESRVRLLADVHLNGSLHGRPFALKASHAELDRAAYAASLTEPVLTGGDQSAGAAHALLHLHRDGTLEDLRAQGAVALRSGTSTVTAPELQASFGAEGRPLHARLSTGVRLVDADRLRPAQGYAGSVDLQWAADSVLSRAAAANDFRFEQSSTAADGAETHRQFTAAGAVASFAGRKGNAPVLQQIRLAGSAHAMSTLEPGAAGDRPSRTAVDADALLASFGQGTMGRPVLQRLLGQGHTRLEETGKDGARQGSTGDTLQADFGPAGGVRGAGPTQVALRYAVQTGHVEVQTWTAPGMGPGARTPVHSTGHAAVATFSAAASTLTLAGAGGERAAVDGSNGDLQAAQLVLHQGSGDLDAQGGVLATSLGQNGGEATHVQASRARFVHASGIAEFFGEAGHPARLWENGSQVEAGSLLLDGKTHVLEARPAQPAGRIHAVFAEAGTGSGTGAARSGSGLPSGRLSGAGGGVLRVSAGRLDFNDVHGEAVFAGGMQVDGTWGQASAGQGTVFLRRGEAPPTAPAAGALPAGMGGALERIVLLGDVKLRQPGRLGTGQQLTYSAPTDSFVLTGTPARPPRVLGEGGSVMTGATLLFHGADSTIVVAGAHGNGKDARPSRVHTETELK